MDSDTFWQVFSYADYKLWIRLYCLNLRSQEFDKWLRALHNSHFGTDTIMWRIDGEDLHLWAMIVLGEKHIIKVLEVVGHIYKAGKGGILCDVLRDHNAKIAKYACAIFTLGATWGQFGVLKWIVEHFKLTKETEHFGVKDAYAIADGKGYSEIARWMESELGLIRGDIGENSERSFVWMMWQLDRLKAKKSKGWNSLRGEV